MRKGAIDSGHSTVKLAAATLLALAVVLAGTSGCSDHWQLFGYGPEYNLRSEGGGGWHIYREGRPPADAVEETVVRVAQSRQPQQVPGADVIFILRDRIFNFVYVVEKDGDLEWLRKKSYTRYVVADSKIVAKSDRLHEFLGDANLERAVLIDAYKAGDMDSVLIYEDAKHPMSISSRPLGPCTADVRVFPPNQVGGVPLAHKIVSYCSLRTLMPPPHG